MLPVECKLDGLSRATKSGYRPPCATRRPDGSIEAGTKGVKLEFFFEGRAVGYFRGRSRLPVEPGTYSFMPYRGMGHYLLTRRADAVNNRLVPGATPALRRPHGRAGTGARNHHHQ